MAKCKLDLKSSPTFIKGLSNLCKDFRKAAEDLDKIVGEVEADHLSLKAYSTRLRMEGSAYAHLQGKVFKYDFGSSDMRKSPRNSFRLVCVFLEEPTKESVSTLYAVLCYHRPNNDNVMPKEIAECVVKLRATL